jgi:hypothetical protein
MHGDVSKNVALFKGYFKKIENCKLATEKYNKKGKIIM